MSATLEDVQKLLTDLVARMNATPVALTPEQVKDIVNGAIEAAKADPEFARKMRFGSTDTRLIGSKFGALKLGMDDIEFAQDLMVADQKRGGRGPSEELANAFKAISNARYVPESELIAADIKFFEGLQRRVPLANAIAIENQIKAMDTAEAGYGQQLIGAQYVGSLWEAARNDSRIFGLLDTIEMTAPTTYVPVEADIPEMLLQSESTANNSSNYTTSKTGSRRAELTAKKFVIHQMWSGEMEEDSILPFVPYLRRQLAIALAHYSDSVVLNGDTTNAGTGNINLDDADPADTKHYLAFDGIRHVGLVDVTANSVDIGNLAITLAALKKSKGRMLDTTYLMDWGHPTDMADLIYLADPETADAISMLDQVLTVDKFGPTAPVVTGQLAKLLGHPLIATIAMSKTEADGKVSTTGSNNTRGQVAVFNRRGFKAGWRRQVKLETERLPATDQTRLVASLRMGFGRYAASGSASGIEAADILYNIAL